MPDWICFFCIVLFLYVTAWPYFLQSICIENASLLTILLAIKGMFFIGWTKFWEIAILVWSLFLYWTKYIPQPYINETWMRICICRCTERIWNVWIYSAIKWRISDMKCFCCLLHVYISKSPYLFYIYRTHL